MAYQTWGMFEWPTKHGACLNGLPNMGHVWMAYQTCGVFEWPTKHEACLNGLPNMRRLACQTWLLFMLFVNVRQRLKTKTSYSCQIWSLFLPTSCLLFRCFSF